MFNIIELTGALTGIAGVWLTIKRNIWCFPVGITSVLLSSFLFYNELLLADAVQHLVYSAILIKGWYEWAKPKPVSRSSVSALDLKGIIATVIFIAFLGSMAGFLLDNFTGAVYPWLDSYLTAACFAAQYLIAIKKIENWPLWIVTNVIYIFIYFEREIYIYSGLYSIYLIMAFIGYETWKKDLNDSKNRQ